MSRIYLSQQTDPYFNVAAEYQLFKQTREDISLFLWRNRPSVIIGRNQNIFAECNTQFLKMRGISPVRRLSGGGAVFQDLGNLNYTFLSREEDADKEKYIKVIRGAMMSMGVECTFSGRNDLLAGGRKFSGQAYYADHGNLLYHGTLMINVDLDMMAGALHPSFIKLSSKGIESVKSRVVNLSDICEGITAQRAAAALINAFKVEYDTDLSVQPLNKANMQPAAFRKISSDEWIYGQAPDFDVKFERKLSFGNACIYADVSCGMITRLKVYTDSLVEIDFTQFEREAAGHLFDEDKLAVQLESYVAKIGT